MIHAEEILKLKRVVNKLYVKHTGQTLEEIGNDELSLHNIHLSVRFQRNYSNGTDFSTPKAPNSSA